MGLFDKKGFPKFGSRSEAFAYMLAIQVEKGKDPMEAAKQADEFATIFARNMGLPQSIEPPKEGIDKYIEMVDKVTCYCEQHPRALDFVTGALTFVVGAFAGKQIEKSSEPTQREPIDFDKID